MLTLKICVTFVSETIEARILKLGIHMDNKLLYRLIENWAHCFVSFLYCSIFLSFQYKLVSQYFPGTVQATIFKHRVHMTNE